MTATNADVQRVHTLAGTIEAGGIIDKQWAFGTDTKQIIVRDGGIYLHMAGLEASNIFEVDQTVKIASGNGSLFLETESLDSDFDLSLKNDSQEWLMSVKGSDSDKWVLRNETSASNSIEVGVDNIAHFIAGIELEANADIIGSGSTNIDIGSNFTVDGSTGDVVIWGVTTLESPLDVNDLATIHSLIVSNDSDFLGDIDVGLGAFTIEASTGNVFQDGSLTVDDSLFVLDDLLVNTDKFTVLGATGNVTTKGNLTIDDGGWLILGGELPTPTTSGIGFGDRDTGGNPIDSFVKIYERADDELTLVGNDVRIGFYTASEEYLNYNSTTDKFTASSGTFDFDNDNLTTTGTVNIGGTIALVGTIDDDTFATATATNIATSESMKADGDASVLAIDIPDNTAEAFNIEEGANHYINIDTTNSAELITIGNTISAPNVEFIEGASTVRFITNRVAQTAHTEADEIEVHNLASSGMTFLTANNSASSIAFGDTDNNRAGQLSYNHVTDIMAFRAAGTYLLNLAGTSLSLLTNVDLNLSTTSDVDIGSGNFTIAGATGDFLTLGNATVGGFINYTPSATADITAGGGITPTQTHMRAQGSGGAVTVTATPSIVLTGLTDGDIVKIEGRSDTNTLTLQDESSLAGSKLELSGAIDVTLGLGDIIRFTYNSSDGKLWEETRSIN